MLETAARFKVLPAQSGPLLLTVGMAGPDGSTRVNGPTTFEGQAPLLTVIVLYTPADKPYISIFPVASEDLVADIVEPPF